MLVIIFGLPGTGKSYFSEHLSDALQLENISSDQVRERMGLKGHYNPEFKEKVYHKMFELAQHAFARGRGVLLDATFSKAAWLNEARELARQHGQKFKVIEMVASEEVIRERVSKTRKHSEADVEVYEKLKKSYQQFEDERLQLDSSADEISPLIEKAIEYLTHD
jgi:predicted kinase